MSYDILVFMEEKMEKAISYLENELKGIRTGQANTNMLDVVNVDYYGVPTPVKQIASITIQEGRTFVIKPYDASSLKDIEKAINIADLGITPMNDGSVIRLTVPKLTEETRREMVKKVNKIAEDAKVQVRNARREYNDQVKKNKEISEDIQKNIMDEIQKVTDKFVEKIDEIASSKEKEVMTI